MVKNKDINRDCEYDQLKSDKNSLKNSTKSDLIIFTYNFKIVHN